MKLLMLSGSEDILRRRALSEAIAKVGVQTGDMDYSVRDGSSSPRDWLGEVSTYPFLAEKRVVVVRNLLRAEPDAKAGFDTIPDTGLLILVADEEAVDDSRRARLATLKTNWEKLVKSAGGHVETFEVSPKNLIKEIRTEAARQGKSISEKSATLLAEMVGSNLTRAYEELEKLAIYCGDADAIREQDVETLVLPSREWNVFKLVDAVVRNEIGPALRQLQVLVGSSNRAEEAAFRSILPQMSRQLRLIWQARICVELGCGPEDVPAQHSSLFPSKPNFLKEPSYRQSVVMGLARRASFASLARCFQILSDADARLKGILPGVSGIETLERMVLEMGREFSEGAQRVSA